MATKNLIVRFVGDSRHLKKETEGLDGAFGGLLKSLGKVAVVAGGTAIAAGLGKSIQIGMEFEKTMNELGAVTNANGRQMKTLGKRARELGSDIQIPGTSSAQAAGAMLELAKGGFSVKESMRAAKGTLILAAAAQIDGARAAEIQIQAINQFGLSAKDASMVADTLANTANAASGGIEDVAEAMKYVGPVARGLGVGIKETSTAIGLLANNGILGSQAGTSLRAILAGLANPSKKAKAALEDLNITAFNQRGEFVGLRSLTEQLSKAKKRLTDQEFAAASAAAFGREPLAAITALANSGTKDFDKMAKAVGRQGGATKVAAAKMQGLGGAWEQFKGQLEDVAIGIYQAISPTLTAIVKQAVGLVEPFGKALTAALNIVFGAFKALFGFIADNKIILVLLGGALAGLAAKLAVMKLMTLGQAAAFKIWYATALVAETVSKLLNGGFKALNATMRANVISIIIIAIAALVAGFIHLWNTSASFRNFWISIWNAIKNAAMFAWNNVIKPAFNGIVAAIKWIGNAAKWLWNNILKPVFSFIANAAKILAAILITVVITPIIFAFKLWATIAKWLFNKVLKPVFNAIATAAKWLWNNVLKPVFNAIKIGFQWLGAGFKWVWNNILKPVLNTYARVARWLWNSVLKPVFGFIKAGFNALATGIRWIFNNIIKPVWNGIGNAIRWVWRNLVKPAFNAIKTGVSSVGTAFKNAANWIKDVWNKVSGYVSKPIKWIVDVVWNNGIRKVWNGVAGLFGLSKLKEVKWAKKAKGGPAKEGEGSFAGMVPGRGFQDRIPALLMPGEYVLPRKVVDAWGMDNIRRAHKATLQDRHSGTEGMQFQHYAAGGKVALQRGVKQAKRMNGKKYRWGGGSEAGVDCSGFMAMIKRAILNQRPYGRREWSTHTAAGGNPPPGFARGKAGGFSIGVAPGSHTAGTLGGMFGIPAVNVEAGGSHMTSAYGGPAIGADHSSFPYKFHLPMFNGAFVSGGAGGYPSLWEELIRKLAQPLNNLWAGLVNKMPGKSGKWKNSVKKIPPELIEKGIAYAKKIVGRSVADVVGDRARDASTHMAGFMESVSSVRRVAGRYGWDRGPQWNALDALIAKESSWDYRIANPRSSARGLFQKMTSIHGPVEATPAGQARWGLNYIRERYGNPIAALRFHNAHGHYKQGTPWVPEDQYAFLHKGEGVIPRKENEARLSGGWGGATYNVHVDIHGNVYGVDDIDRAVEGAFKKLETMAGL